MKEVVQENPFGCGIACTASILEISYSDSLQKFKNGFYKAENEGFYCREIVEVLKKCGLNYSFKEAAADTSTIKPGTIVFVKRSTKYPFGHYLTLTENGWMDPWINFPDDRRESGFREVLPGEAEYLILPNN